VLLRALLVERRVVEHLAQIALGDTRFERSRVQLRAAARGRRRSARGRRLDLRLDVDHVEQQQRVVRGERAPDSLITCGIGSSFSRHGSARV
jgi:hypothetical protein